MADDADMLAYLGTSQASSSRRQEEHYMAENNCPHTARLPSDIIPHATQSLRTCFLKTSCGFARDNPFFLAIRKCSWKACKALNYRTHTWRPCWQACFYAKPRKYTSHLESSPPSAEYFCHEYVQLCGTISPQLLGGA